MSRRVRSRISRVIILGNAIEFSHPISQVASEISTTASGHEYLVLRNPNDTSDFAWEGGNREAESIKRILANGEMVGILHCAGIVHARLAIRTKGWVSIATKKRFRRLNTGEALVHHVRTAEFAKGNGYQAKMYRHFLSVHILGDIQQVTSFVGKHNIASIKGTERSGAARVREIRSVGFLGGRLGFSITRLIEDSPTLTGGKRSESV